MTGFQTERTKPFPIQAIDFSNNDITGEGIGAVVQFARTQGSDATHIDLSKNKLDDKAAQEEVTRLVKNYSSFAANAFINTLILSGNNIGRAGARRPGAAHVTSRALRSRGLAPPILVSPVARRLPVPIAADASDPPCRGACSQARRSSSSTPTGSATASRPMLSRLRHSSST